MKKILTFLLVFLSSSVAFANTENGPGNGFYVGVDPSKTNDKIGAVDKSVSLDSKVTTDRYYGYKFSGGGLFVAPELFQNESQTTLQSPGVTKTDPNSVAGLNYNVKANVGYDFNSHVSGFLTYDLGTFAYNPGQKMTVGSNRATNSAVGIGSQINFSNSFGIKIIYSQQQFENTAVVGGGQVRSDVIKLGTVYSF